MEEMNPKPHVFVLMPFKEEFSDVYQFGIKSACQEVGAYCSRIDEQSFTESIFERLFNQIARADIIVADMSGRNPNVFFEVGYAYALNKKVVLLAQNPTDIPFDLKIYPHIIYGSQIITLKHQLETWIRSNIEVIKGRILNADPKDPATTTSKEYEQRDEERELPSTQLTDEQLLQQIGKYRDTRAFDIFYERTSPAIIRHARNALAEENLSDNEELLKDLIGRILIEIWVQAERFNPDEMTLENWLAYLIRGCIHDILYKEQSKLGGEVLLSNIPHGIKTIIDHSQETEVESQLLRIDAERTLKAALEELSPIQRKIIELWIDGHTSSEIASSLERSPAFIRQSIARAKRRLRNTLIHKERS